jgi:apolipoprotein N-acyltransferase
MFAYPWILQAADLAGVGGLTFVLLIVNLCVAETVRRRAVERYMMRESLLPTACAALLVAAVASYGALRERQFAAPATSAGAGTDGTIRVALVQADISDYDRMRAEIGSYETVRRVLDAHYELSRRALRSTPALDLLVWPETVYPTSFGKPKSEQGADFDREIADFVAASGVPLIFGTYDSDGSGEYNAAAFLEPRPEARSDFQSYRKTMLFPLTERVPAVLESGVLRGALPWLGTWKPGSGPKVVPVTLPRTGRKLRIAPLICFDAIAPPLALEAVRKGAELIVTLSNDAWFSDGRGPWQHLVVSAFRSVETRRPQVRVTNTGISAVITPTGKIVELASVHEATVLVASVTPVAEATTLVLRWGDWFGPTALAAAALLALTAGAALRRSEHR